MIDPNNILEDMFVTDVKENESGFNYTGFTHRSNRWVIIQENISSGAFRYKLGNNDYVTNFNNRSSLGYARPEEFK